MLRRGLTILATATVIVLASAGSALAGDPWGKVDCEKNPQPACDLWAGRDRGDGDRDRGDSDEGSTGSRRRSDGDQQALERPSDRLIGPNEKSGQCRYVRSDYQPPRPTMRPAAFAPPERDSVLRVQPATFLATQLAPGPGGAWYVYRCARPGFRDALWHAPVWIPDGQDVPEGPALPSPEELAQLARDQLNLPEPWIMKSPAAEQLVQLPTWLWLDPGGWDTVTATASVPGVSVTAVATPTSVSWSMGDGGSTSCDGPGTAYTATNDPKAASPDCGYTYRTSSGGQPDQAFPVTATVQWTVTWSGAGQSGVFPGLTTSASTRFRVAESQALNTD